MSNASQGPETGAGAPCAVAYLAEGKLFTAVEGGAKPRLIESHFAQEMLDRRERNRQRNEWRESGGMAWGFNRMVPGLPGAPDAAARPIRFECLSRARDGAGDLLYALQTEAVGGLFYWEQKTGYERRLFHRAHFHARDVACHPGDGTIAVAVRVDDGAVNIAVMKPDGRGMREITAGDSADECPAWVPPAAAGGADKHVLVYQSAGLGRGAHGLVVEQGPYAVFQLDVDGGEMRTLLESDEHDYLSPRVAPDGSLYYITRPYQSRRPQVSAVKVAKDIVLFPFRLVLAVVHFLDWFSMVFRRKPLLTAGGPPKEGPDARHMMLWGKLVDAEKAHAELKAGGGGAAGAALVPKTWELRRRMPDKSENTLATNVIHFDLCADGGVVYTNGATVYRLAPDGRRTEICSARLIERVLWLPDAAGATATP